MQLYKVTTGSVTGLNGVTYAQDKEVRADAFAPGNLKVFEKKGFLTKVSKPETKKDSK